MGKIKQKHVPAIDDDGENEQEMAKKKKKKKIGRKSPCPPSTDGADRRLSAPHRSAVKARRICQRQPQDQQEERWKKKKSTTTKKKQKTATFIAVTGRPTSNPLNFRIHTRHFLFINLT